MRRRYFVALTIGISACGAEITSPTVPGIDDVAVLVGAADIAVCGAGGSMETGRMLDAQEGTIFIAGDIAYTEGTAEQFRSCYDPVWGRHKARTRPAPGNHEYGSAGAAPYFAYFGLNAGPIGLGYYSYRKGSWLVLALNSNTDGAERMAQLAWLRRELASQPSDCTVAYFHHPLFSSGPHGTVPSMPVVADFWRELYVAGAEVVITGHEHFYERFAPQTPDGAPDQRFGLRQFVVGTGGAPMTQPVRRVANSEAVVISFGLLRLTLDPQSYRWDFLSVDGGARDSGTASCHGKP